MPLLPTEGQASLPPDLKQEARSLARSILAQTNSDGWDPQRKLYLDAWEPGKKSDQPAFNWGVGVMLSALNAMAPWDESAAHRRQEWMPVIQSYWNSAGPVAGFDVLPAPKPPDRYYDDNAWMVLALMEAWDQTRDRSALTLSLKALDYSLSGWSGAGIYWRESDKASVNTCSNAPVAAGALRAYHLTQKEEYKEWAFRILDWMLPALQDPEDGLMWDNLSNEGKVEKMKWSYNSALTVKAMIEAEALGWKGRMSGRDVFRSSWAKWFDSSTGQMRDPGRFAHLLVDVGLDHGLIPQEDQKKLLAALGRLHQGHRVGDRWDGPHKGSRFELIDQASVLRTLARLGQ